MVGSDISRILLADTVGRDLLAIKHRAHSLWISIFVILREGVTKSLDSLDVAVGVLNVDAKDELVVGVLLSHLEHSPSRSMLTLWSLQALGQMGNSCKQLSNNGCKGIAHL